jgi:hypothetical protein
MKKAIIGGVFLLVVIFASTTIIPSCTHDALDLARFDTICFEKEILPVFQNGCAITGCHGAGGHGMQLNTYSGISREVTAGSPSQSRIYQVITANLIQPMPPSHALAEPDRIKIRLWIEQGAKNTSCTTEPSTNLTNPGGVK